MVNQQLVSYIQEQLRRGYDINSIRTYLTNLGHNPYEIDEAMSYIYYGKKPRSKILVAFAVFIGFFLVVSIFVFYFMTRQQPIYLLDLESRPLETKILQGGHIEFNVELTNMGAARRYDVLATHEVTDSEGNIIATKQETIAIETRASKKSTIEIPADTKPGKYYVKTTALYDSQKAEAIFMFEVESSQKPIIKQVQKECPVSCDDSNICTEDKCSEATDFNCVNIPIIQCCGNNICEETESPESCSRDCPVQIILPPGATFGEKIEVIKQTAQTDINKALQLCGSFERGIEKDDCYGAVFSSTNMIQVCDRISDISRRDVCYLTFAMNNNFADACGKIFNANLKASCEAVVS